MGKVGTAPGTTVLTLPGGQTVALADWVDDRNWTTIELSTGDTDALQAFANGKSQPIVGGTRNMNSVDTNIQGTGLTGLNKAWEFMIYGWAVEFMRATRAVGGAITFAGFSDPVDTRTAFEMNRRIFLQYWYNGKAYTDGLIEDYPSGSGLSVMTTNALREIVNNGIPSPRDRIALVLPVREREQNSYFMNVQPVVALAIAQIATDGGANLDTVDLRIKKNGLIKRNVV